MIAKETAKLRKGSARSCGCLGRDVRRAQLTTHGQSTTKEYRAWHGMKGRCNNPNDKAYADYGGRGIRVCDRWNNSFEAFLADMGAAPSANHSLDRINNDAGYEPGNVRWATVTTQLRNQRRTHYLTYNGETLSLAAWAERVGLPRAALSSRIHAGWATDRALTQPLRRTNRDHSG